jgi:HEAT repeat protein
MSALLSAAVLGLAAVVVLLSGAIVVARVVLLRRLKRQRRLRPRAETLLAEYLAGAPALPSAATGKERAVLLDVALEAIADLRGAERERLVSLLEELGFVREAIQGLNARRRISRRQAAEVLATVGNPAAAGALASGLPDRDVQVRVTCAYALAETGREDAVPAVIATIMRDAARAPGATGAAMLALGARQPSALAPLLARDAPPVVRQTAIRVVSELRLPQYLPALRACLTDSGGAGGDEVAASAAHGVGLIGDSGAVAALIALAADARRPAAARAAAAQALGSIGDPRAIPVLDALLWAPDWTLGAAASRALGELGEPGTAVLRRAAMSSGAEAAALARAALQP